VDSSDIAAFVAAVVASVDAGEAVGVAMTACCSLETEIAAVVELVVAFVTWPPVAAMSSLSHL